MHWEKFFIDICAIGANQIIAERSKSRQAHHHIQKKNLIQLLETVFYDCRSVFTSICFIPFSWNHWILSETVVCTMYIKHFQ